MTDDQTTQRMVVVFALAITYTAPTDYLFESLREWIHGQTILWPSEYAACRDLLSIDVTEASPDDAARLDLAIRRLDLDQATTDAGDPDVPIEQRLAALDAARIRARFDPGQETTP